MYRIVVACALLVVPAAPLAAQSVDGTWDATMSTPGGSSSFKLLLRTTGDTVSGTVYRTSGEVSLAGMMKGDSLHFSYTIVYNESPFPLTVAVQVKGDSMTGMVDFDGKAQEPFSAVRQPPVKSE